MTLAAYKARLAAHEWTLRKTEADERNEVELIQLAYKHGDEFKTAFNLFYRPAWGIPFFKFPVATTANEQPKTNTQNMNITLNITADPVIITAINNLAEVYKSKACTQTVAPAPVAVETPAPVEPETPVEVEVEAPKKKKAAEKKPVEVKPEPAPVEAETTIVEDGPTPAELKDKILPLKGTDYTKRLRTYMDTQLDLKDVALSAVTDNEKRKKIGAAIDKLLAEKAKADETAAVESDDV